MFQPNALLVYPLSYRVPVRERGRIRVIIYFFHISVHVSSHIVLIIRRVYCIYTASGSLYVTLLR